MAAARFRPAAWACALTLVLAGCTYAPEEPGLFPTPKPRTTSAGPPRERFAPQPTNPRLPVVGERIWISGFTQLAITFRIAVHAVRRVEGATVLDWSITPISAPGYAFSDDLPNTDLGLESGTRASPTVALLDPTARKAYQPLVHRSREEFNHCLCVPLVRLQQDLRVGETRLLQVSFPSLPESLDSVDVSVATVAPFHHVPVSPVGTAPMAQQPTDLTRPGEIGPPGREKIDFPNPSRSKQFQRIQVNRVLAAPGRSTLEWTLTTLVDQDNRVLDYGPPVESPPGDLEVVGSSQASGPVLRTKSARLPNLWSRTTIFNRAAYECQCTEIGLWASGLRNEGVSVRLVTNFAGLPAGTRTADIEFPGFGTFRGVKVEDAEDAATGVRPAEPAETGRWTYSLENLPSGWPTSEWPTDTPDTSDLADYQARVEPLLTLPAAR